MVTLTPRPVRSARPTSPSGRSSWERSTLLASGGLLIVWLLTRREELATGLTAIAGATPAWLLMAVLAAVTVQIAAAGALYAVALHALELEPAGSSRSGSWSAVITVRTITSLLHVLALVAALPVGHRTRVPALHVPAWSLPLLLAVGVIVLGTAATSPALRGRAVACWAQRPPTVPLMAVLRLFLVAEAAGALSGRTAWARSICSSWPGWRLPGWVRRSRWRLWSCTDSSPPGCRSSRVWSP